jgi:hypothetical protein
MLGRRVQVSVSLVAVALLCGVMAAFAADPPIPIGVAVAQTGPLALAGQNQVSARRSPRSSSTSRAA